MTIQKILYTTSLALLSLCSVNFIMPLTCEARQVMVDWGVVSAESSAESGTESSVSSQKGTITTRVEALNYALVRATTEEAFSLLPQKMPEAQKAALKKYLAAKAPMLVLGYREEGLSQLPTGQYRLTVDVNVNRQWLVDALQRLGVSYTAKQSEPVSCTFYYVGQSDADKKSSEYKKASNDITLLSTAAGVRGGTLNFVTAVALAEMDKEVDIEPNTTPNVSPTAVPDIHPDAITEALNAAKMGADSGVQIAQADNQEEVFSPSPKELKSLRFLLIPQGKDAWLAKLQGPQYDATSQGNSIDAVWEKLWPIYLSKQNRGEKSASKAASLQVWGWSSADGVVVFDKAIRTWCKERGLSDKDLDLLKITMQSGAVKAVWRVNMADSTKLKAYVSQYAGQRRLRFELAPLGQGLNEHPRAD